MIRSHSKGAGSNGLGRSRTSTSSLLPAYLVKVHTPHAPRHATPRVRYPNRLSLRLIGVRAQTPVWYTVQALGSSGLARLIAHGCLVAAVTTVRGAIKWALPRRRALVIVHSNCPRGSIYKGRYIPCVNGRKGGRVLVLTEWVVIAATAPSRILRGESLHGKLEDTAKFIKLGDIFPVTRGQAVF